MCIQKVEASTSAYANKSERTLVSETPGTWSLLGTCSVFNPQNQPVIKELTDIKDRKTWTDT